MRVRVCVRVYVCVRGEFGVTALLMKWREALDTQQRPTELSVPGLELPHLRTLYGGHIN